MAFLAIAAVACDDGGTGEITVEEVTPVADEADGREGESINGDAAGGDTSSGDTQGGGEPPGETPAATPTPTPEIAPVDIQTSPDNPPYARLLSGSATMTENEAGGTDISLTTTGQDYEILPAVVPSLREGTCESPGEVHVELPQHVTDIGEDVTVETTIDDPPFAHWLEAPHHIAIYDPQGDTRLACGDVLAAS